MKPLLKRFRRPVVEFPDGRVARFDTVTVYASGMLRATITNRWHSKMVGGAGAEGLKATQSAYYAPGSWISVQAAPTGALIAITRFTPLDGDIRLWRDLVESNVSRTSARQHAIAYLRNEAPTLYSRHEFVADSVLVDNWKVDDDRTVSFHIEWPNDRPEADMYTALDTELTVPKAGAWRPNNNNPGFADEASGPSG